MMSIGFTVLKSLFAASKARNTPLDRGDIVGGTSDVEFEIGRKGKAVLEGPNNELIKMKGTRNGIKVKRRRRNSAGQNEGITRGQFEAFFTFRKLIFIGSKGYIEIAENFIKNNTFEINVGGGFVELDKEGRLLVFDKEKIFGNAENVSIDEAKLRVVNGDEVTLGGIEFTHSVGREEKELKNEMEEVFGDFLNLMKKRRLEMIWYVQELIKDSKEEDEGVVDETTSGNIDSDEESQIEDDFAMAEYWVRSFMSEFGAGFSEPPVIERSKRDLSIVKNMSTMHMRPSVNATRLHSFTGNGTEVVEVISSTVRIGNEDWSFIGFQNQTGYILKSNLESNATS